MAQYFFTHIGKDNAAHGEVAEESDPEGVVMVHAFKSEIDCEEHQHSGKCACQHAARLCRSYIYAVPYKCRHTAEREEQCPV